ncbi:MAG: hypothetical protein NTV51_04145, partial [Verrucomicrobia bacterium]|nr:hypothetical protein [Verrucomicrobiota bacterium]
AYDPVGHEAVRAAWEDQRPMPAYTVALSSDDAAQRAASPCAGEGTTRSRRSDEAVRLIIRNRATTAILTYWLDFEGKRRAYGGIDIGGLQGQDTYARHSWLLADRAGQCLAIIAPEADGAHVTLAP